MVDSSLDRDKEKGWSGAGTWFGGGICAHAGRKDTFRTLIFKKCGNKKLISGVCDNVKTRLKQGTTEFKDTWLIQERTH